MSDKPEYSLARLVQREVERQNEAQRLVESATAGYQLMKAHEALAGLDNSALAAVKRSLENSPAEMLRRSLESDPITKMMRDFQGAQERATPHSAFALHVQKYAEDRQRIEEMLRPRGAFQDAIDNYKALSDEIAKAIHPFETKYADLDRNGWADPLEQGLKSLSPTDWMLRDFASHSLLGFGHLQRLSDAVHSHDPFQPIVRELLAEELGDLNDEKIDSSPAERDEAAIEQGMRPDLLAFPSASYGSVLYTVGFTFTSSPPPMPAVVEGGDPTAVFAPSYLQIVLEVELHLRKLVEDCLQQIHGANWLVQGVQKDMRLRWAEGQETVRKKQQTVYSDIHYSHLPELFEIIRRSDHWEKAFRAIFRSLDELSISIQRLYRVRNPLAHGRPIGHADILMLMNEATSVLGALGVKTLNRKQ